MNIEQIDGREVGHLFKGEITQDNNVMHTNPDLRVFLKWMIAGSGSVITDVIRVRKGSQMIRRQYILTAIAVLFVQGAVAHSVQDAEPTAAEILNRYVEAVGGHETLGSVATMKSVSTVTQHQIVGGKETSSEYKITKLRSQERWVKRCSMGPDSAFDGSKYWMKQKEGKKIESLEASRYPYDCLDPIVYSLHLADFPGTIKFAGKNELGDKPVFRLKVEPAVPETSNKIRLTPRELVFDVKTGLLLKIVHDGKVVELEDYREVEGMLVPFRYIVTYNLGVIYSKSKICLLYTSPSPRDLSTSRMPSSA